MKRGVVVTLTLLTILFVVACGGVENEDEEQQTMVSTEKLWYALEMQFRFRIIIEGEEYNHFPFVVEMVVPGERFDPFYDELVFVHGEAEAANLPDNVIAAWPTDATLGVIEGLHWAVANEDEIGHRDWREVISFEDFGLSYPLTTEDLVNQWENVNELWNTLTSSEQETIIHFAPRGGPIETRQLEDEDNSEADDCGGE